MLLALPFFCISQESDSLNVNDGVQKLIHESQQTQLTDSLKKIELLDKISNVKKEEILKKQKLLVELKKIEVSETESKRLTREKIEKLKLTQKGFPVILLRDTLFSIYTKGGSLIPRERALNISEKIKLLYEDDFLKIDSITTIAWENAIDIIYKDMVIMSISDLDGIWFDNTKQELASDYAKIIKKSIIKQKEENSVKKIMIRIGLVFLVLAFFYLFIWIINRFHLKVVNNIVSKRKDLLKNITYKGYTYLTAEQELRAAILVIRGLRWFLILLLVYLALPLIFSIFPFTQTWAKQLFSLLWLPFKSIFIAVWKYLPNLLSILVIFFIMKYCIRVIKYIFGEIESGKLKISGFHTDWAIPTFSIVKILLYAFMFVLMFPYLPGSDSDIFKGVSVFIGILFSLGSSSAISNMVAGLVITYMRPFKVGDQIKIGDMMGIVIEKNLLVTRLKTVKNEEITIPNSTVLSGNTINYSVYTENEGIIVHTAVTVGYEIPWRVAEEALLEGALKTPLIQQNPKPFILQTALDDFYASYEVNVYIDNVRKKVEILSNLRKNIQDVFNERGIEMLSPHYIVNRDGNTLTIPNKYLNKDDIKDENKG